MEETDIKKRVQEVIEKIRPHLQMDGGDVALVGVEDNVVKVELQGRCKGCPMSQITLQMGIERTIKEQIPEIEKVEAVNSSVPPEMFEHIKKVYGEQKE